VSKASGIIPTKPFDLSRGKFAKHIDLFDQYKILLKIEYYVSDGNVLAELSGI
jgi:hypothetical protein